MTDSFNFLLVRFRHTSSILIVDLLGNGKVIESGGRADAISLVEVDGWLGIHDGLLYPCLSSSQTDAAHDLMAAYIATACKLQQKLSKAKIVLSLWNSFGVGQYLMVQLLGAAVVRKYWPPERYMARR
eukprot:4579125-Amphidinium_carterae.1